MSAPKPPNSIYRKGILPPSELRCHIAYATSETCYESKFSCGDGDKGPSTPYKTPRTLREHLRRNDERALHDDWGDGIEITTPAEAATATAPRETPYIITRDEDDKIISRTGVASVAPSSVQATALALQAPQSSFPQTPIRSPLPTFPAQRNNHPPMSSQLFNSIKGHVILPPTETRCRIAYTDPSLSRGWRFSCGSSAIEATYVLCNHQSLRNHLTDTGRFASHRKDGIVLASREEVAIAEEPSRPRVPYIITRDGNGDIIDRAGIVVPGSVPPVSMAQAPASAPIPRVSNSQAQQPSGFKPAQPSPRPSHLPRTKPLYVKDVSHLPRTRPLYDDGDYPGIPREVQRLEHEPVGTYLVRGNYLYLESRNTLGHPTFRLHGIYERIDR